MVLSMTGYGRAGALLHGRDIKVELRSVNARFFEYSSRLPRSCAFLEDKLKKAGSFQGQPRQGGIKPFHPDGHRRRYRGVGQLAAGRGATAPP